MLHERIFIFRENGALKGPVVYWMSRDQRADDNWALIAAAEAARARRVPLAVAFSLAPHFLGAARRQYSFMFNGLERVERKLADKNIPFFLLKGSPEDTIPQFVKKHAVSAIFADFDPLRIKRKWKKLVMDRTDASFYEVDAHNVVPCREASDKKEFAARTIRPKIHKLLPLYMDEFPKLRKHPYKWAARAKNDWERIAGEVKADESVPPVDGLEPGEAAAKKALRDFINDKLDGYGDGRNFPDSDGLSGLSPYLHFGQIAAQRVAIEAEKSGAPGRSVEAFLEQLIVRKELADNYCFHEPHYDGFAGFPEWGKKTLNKHRKDKREYLYTAKKLEKAATHDELWNAAQREMAVTGRMHGYMRMYWCKKILEWTRSPEEAQRIAIYLNDKYELDGRDPNGYAGIAWSIGGLHDRPWGERRTFGTIRYMSYNGCKGKFDIGAYINKTRV